MVVPVLEELGIVEKIEKNMTTRKASQRGMCVMSLFIVRHLGHVPYSSGNY